MRFSNYRSCITRPGLGQSTLFYKNKLHKKKEAEFSARLKFIKLASSKTENWNNNDFS